MKDRLTGGKVPFCWETYIAGAALAAMTVLMALGVFSRFTKLFVITFTEDIVIQLFLVTTMFAISECVMDKTHMGLSLITDKFTGKAKVFSLIFIFVMELAMFVFLGVVGIQMIISQYTYHLVTSVLQMDKWIFTTAFPIGSALFIFRASQQLIIDLKGERAK